MTSPVVQCTKLLRTYGALHAVNKIDFHVNSGEVFGLLGPNGAGKSSLIRMLYGSSPRTSGALSVYGLDPQKDGRKLKERVGVVPQSNCLDDALSVRENLEIFCRFHSLNKTKAKDKIDYFLKLFSLEGKAKSKVSSLSGGMQRRLAFVRALLHEPDLLILDEPTTGLDPAVRQLLWSRVKELNSKGSTIIVSTHYMEEAERLCSRLVIMDLGKIVSEGSPQSLKEEHSVSSLEEVFLKVSGRRLGVDE